MTVNKLEFINELGALLAPLPVQEIQKVLDYYVESIDDRMEDGMTEEEAIASLGDLTELAEKILSEQPNLSVPPDAPPEPRKQRLPVWAIVLLILGSPLWLGLGAGLLGAFLGIYVAVWSVLLSLLVSAVACLFGGLVGAVVSFFFTVVPDTLSVQVLACGLCLITAAVGFMLLPLSLYLIRGFGRLHRVLFRKLFRKEAV
jgi:uncharacterized membrane protein